ncbi:hypothetical protein [Kitasatospora sp. CMC57]|uniref:hypothetical protein n=1 Tax=Kitasatospora sp. CMC57 TaxID=3231513 RepID=UPI0038B42862
MFASVAMLAGVGLFAFSTPAQAATSCSGTVTYDESVAHGYVRPGHECSVSSGTQGC